MDGLARAVVQRQGLLCPTHAIEPQEIKPGPPIPGPRVSDHGPLVLEL